MQLSNDRITIKNTYEINAIINDKIGKIGKKQFFDNDDFYFLIEIMGDKFLIDPIDVLFLSRYIEIIPINFTNNEIIGYTCFNNSFYTIIDLIALLNGRHKNDNKVNLYLYFYEKKDIFQIPNMKLLKKRGLQEIRQDNKFSIYTKSLLKDINGNFYYLLDHTKLKPNV